MSRLRVALCGNPNVGKSTVFNALTGLKQHTGNWAGKTVDSAIGCVQDGNDNWELIDLPGAYSLLSGSPEEMLASDALIFEPTDAVVVVCDAMCLERNLNLALQVIHSCPRTVLCINMVDEAQKSGLHINLPTMEAELGVPVVAISARRKKGLDELKRRVREAAAAPERVSAFPCPDALREHISALCMAIKQHCAALGSSGAAFAAARVLIGCQGTKQALLERADDPHLLAQAIAHAQSQLLADGITRESLVSALVSFSYQESRRLCERCVSEAEVRRSGLQLKLDKALANRWVGLPVMLAIWSVVLYITLVGANAPSEWLSQRFGDFQPVLDTWLTALSLPFWLHDMLLHGVYRVTTWVISVMLPPMAIFFPLFTLLEDLGLLPRIAFHLDRCFQCCNACGKQALCMAMGLGCNAVGITGCRIIQTPRERLIAMLTNTLTPCNGRFPMLLALISMFLVSAESKYASLLGTLWLVAFILLSVAATWLASWLLAKTLLRGIPSSFALELPPFRRPKLMEVLVRSVLDRTLFVLGRALAVAVPAGALVWCLTHLSLGQVPLLQACAAWFDPLGRALGMDGVIMLSFVLGIPANEIVLPIILTAYLGQQTLVELQGVEALRQILIANGWTWMTACATMVFTLFHWPCSTAALTLYKESRSLRWTALGVILPTAMGMLLCALLTFVARLLL